MAPPCLVGRLSLLDALLFFLRWLFIIWTYSRVSEILSDFIPQFGVLVCVVFNIYVCCSAKHLANEFIGLLK